MFEIANKCVLIAGASSGLGGAAARRLAKRGARLMLAARRADRLKALAESVRVNCGEATYQPVDVTDRNAMQALAEATQKAYGRIDVLIANAGRMPLALLDVLKVDEWDRMIDVNIKGVLYSVAAVLTIMRKQHAGHIVNLCSVAGHKVFAGGVVYCATKFAVRAISEGIRQEAGGEIRVTNISPDAVATELTDHSTDPAARAAAEKVYEIAIDADAIARAIIYAIEQPENVSVNEIIVRPTKQELQARRHPQHGSCGDSRSLLHLWVRSERSGRASRDFHETEAHSHSM